MAQVFLSYDREDAGKARSIAVALEKAGHSVWWDRHIKGGAQYSKAIEAALNRAEAIVVLWSEHSVDSAWVRDEAAAGRDSARLVPASLDGTDPPMGFRQYQTVDLSRWKGRGKPAELMTLLDSVDGLGVDPTAAATGSTPARPAREAPERRVTMFAGIVMLAAITLMALFWFKPWRSGPSVPIVEVAAAESSSASRALARDLLVKLGNIESTRPGLMNLVDISRDRTPSLILEAGAINGEQVAASLILRDGKDRGLLWSKDFQQPSKNQADLRQQVAFTAARVLACALEGLGPDDQRLKSRTLKLYLNACAQLAEIARADARPVIPVLLQVIRDAPDFKPAWAKLLYAEAETADVIFTGAVLDMTARTELRRHIDQARKIDPTMAEATLAEITLLPLGSFAEAMRLVDRAKQRSPDNPSVLHARSSLLGIVGRTRESIQDIGRAAELDPLSPVISNAHISALAYAGMLDTAREELNRAEQLWPGSATLRDAQYRFHLRVGDPEEALRMAKSEARGTGAELFLEARIDPTPEKIDRLIAYMNSRKGISAGGPLGFIVQAYGEFGRHDDLFEEVMKWPHPKEVSAAVDVLFRPALRKFRHDPRFMQVAQRAGLLAYWREGGIWTDFCRDPDLPYDCKAEAAKIAA